MTLRRLTFADLPHAVEISAAAGWNQTLIEWSNLLELAPETCFGIELDGSLAATATLLPYGRRLAWLGMVLTKREYQRRGLARQLMAHTLQAADALGIETVKLDATDQGQPLYEKLGFVAERPIERWTWGGATQASAGDSMSVPLASLAALDREAFGVDRTQLLSILAMPRSSASAPALCPEPMVSDDGFAIWRHGRVANYLGPCVAKDPDAARRLVAGCLAQADGGWMWDLFPVNAHAVELARQFGFQPARRLMRMCRGSAIVDRPELVYGIAGFQFG